MLLEGPDTLLAVVLSEGVPLVVGRAADVILNDRSLSRYHARFLLSNGTVVVEDMGSTNGVQFEDERVDRAVLEDGESVVLGSIRATVSGVHASSEPGHLRSWTAFRTAAESELERARVFGRPCCFVALRAESSMDWEPITKYLRTVDLAHAYTHDVALVLLPETQGEVALDIARHLTLRLALPLAVRVAVFPAAGMHFEALLDRLIHTVRSAEAQSLELVAPSTPGSERASGPVVVSECMHRLYGLVERMARATLPVLVLGETGAGKELVARAVHDRSARAQGPFVTINCASIPASLIESVLFGHERGAFTGASERKAGVFEQANGGTVFLEEVGELSAQVQAALLRVLKTKSVVRRGSNLELQVDVRLVAATHRNLSALVASGAFREDLMFRLDALTLWVPPLRERVEEIEPLAQRFLQQARERWGGSASTFSKDASAALQAYSWPGNIRQLKNVVERAAVVCAGGVVELEDLPEALLPPEPPPPPQREALLESAPNLSPMTAETAEQKDWDLSLDERMRIFEASLIREALYKTGGNRSKAAALLQVPRRTLTYKLHALGLDSE